MTTPSSPNDSIGDPVALKVKAAGSPPTSCGDDERVECGDGEEECGSGGISLKYGKAAREKSATIGLAFVFNFLMKKSLNDPNEASSNSEVSTP